MRDVFVVGRTEKGHQESGEVLGIRPSLDVLVCFLCHFLAHLPFHFRKIGDIAIVHDGMDAERKWVVIGWRDGCSSSSSDMREDHLARSVATYRAEVRIV